VFKKIGYIRVKSIFDFLEVIQHLSTFFFMETSFFMEDTVHEYEDTVT